jgi:hypothetical protein
MSGGSYDYLYHRIEDLADHIELVNNTDRNDLDACRLDALFDAAATERAWFVGLLRLVATAAHDVEWVDSGDYGLGAEVAAIRACRAYIGEGE